MYVYKVDPGSKNLREKIDFNLDDLNDFCRKHDLYVEWRRDFVRNRYTIRFTNILNGKVLVVGIYESGDPYLEIGNVVIDNYPDLILVLKKEFYILESMSDYHFSGHRRES